jgi:hypothetical protein
MRSRLGYDVGWRLGVEAMIWLVVGAARFREDGPQSLRAVARAWSRLASYRASAGRVYICQGALLLMHGLIEHIEAAIHLEEIVQFRHEVEGHRAARHG